MTTKVLVADDEELERRAIRKILENEPDLEILEAENGIQALDWVARTPVSVAILDIKMPGLDGMAVAERLREDHPDVAIIFLTAYDQFDYARTALRLQVDDFLLKPASAVEVVSTLRKVRDRLATRESARQSSQAALFRLDSAIDLVAQRLRHDLAEGLPDPEHVLKFLDLQGMRGHSLVLLECRPTQPSSQLTHVATLAESWFSTGEAVALAGVLGQTLRVLCMGGPDQRPQDPSPQIRKFRETVRSESGCWLWVGAAVASSDTVHPDALVTAAHRAATITNAANPIMVVTVGSDPAEPVHGKAAPASQLPAVVARALDTMEARMTEDISLNEVAALVGLSPSHLSRQLARATGKGFADCLAQFRIDAAKKYLANGSLAVKEVAHLVGFHDPAYFARVFRRLEGRSPADFRSEAGGGRP